MTYPRSLEKALPHKETLTSLWLHKEVRGRIPDVVFEFRNLEKLVLSLNQDLVIPPQIAQLEKLRELNLRGCQLEEFPMALAGLPNLRELNLRENRLRTLSPEIGALTGLEYLDLSKNRLVELPDEIGGMARLKNLDLRDNQLRDLPPGFANLQALETLLLTNNHFTALPLVICQLENLRSLNLSEHRLPTLPPEIGQLRSLVSLSLRRAGLRVIPPEIGNLRALEYLSLSSNKSLTTLPPEIGQLEALENLNVTLTGLTALPAEILQLRALKKLDASFCRLQWAPEGLRDLTRLPFLEDLRLSRNPELAACQFRLTPGTTPVDIHACTDFGRTPLHTVAHAVIPHALARDMVASLLALGADPNAPDHWGYTSLHDAALSVHAEAVGLLLEAGADPTLRVTKGLHLGATALELVLYASGAASNAREAYRATRDRLEPVSPTPQETPRSWYDVSHRRGTYNFNSSSKVCHVAQLHYKYGQIRWECQGSAETGYTCQSSGRELSTFTHRNPMQEGDTIAKTGCPMCDSQNERMIWSSSGFNAATGDGWSNREAYCNNCGWYSQWLYSE